MVPVNVGPVRCPDAAASGVCSFASEPCEGRATAPDASEHAAPPTGGPGPGRTSSSCCARPPHLLIRYCKVRSSSCVLRGVYDMGVSGGGPLVTSVTRSVGFDLCGGVSAGRCRCITLLHAPAPPALAPPRAALTAAAGTTAGTPIVAPGGAPGPSTCSCAEAGTTARPARKVDECRHARPSPCGCTRAAPDTTLPPALPVSGIPSAGVWSGRFDAAFRALPAASPSCARTSEAVLRPHSTFGFGSSGAACICSLLPEAVLQPHCTSVSPSLSVCAWIPGVG